MMIPQFVVLHLYAMTYLQPCGLQVGYQSWPFFQTSSVCPKNPIEDVYRYISIYMKKMYM